MGFGRMLAWDSTLMQVLTDDNEQWGLGSGGN